jgi:hypothetical protein
MRLDVMAAVIPPDREEPLFDLRAGDLRLIPAVFGFGFGFGLDFMRRFSTGPVEVSSPSLCGRSPCAAMAAAISACRAGCVMSPGTWSGRTATYPFTLVRFAFAMGPQWGAMVVLSIGIRRSHDAPREPYLLLAA